MGTLLPVAVLVGDAYALEREVVGGCKKGAKVAAPLVDLSHGTRVGNDAALGWNAALSPSVT